MSLSPPSLITQQPGAVTLRAAGKMSLPRPGFPPLHQPRTSPPSRKQASRSAQRRGRPRKSPRPRAGQGAPGFHGGSAESLSRAQPGLQREAPGCCFALLFAMATDLPAPTSTPRAHALAPHAHTLALPAPRPHTRPPPDASASKPRGGRAGKPWACRHNPRPEARAFVNLNESYLGFSTYLLYLSASWNGLHHYKVKQGDGRDHVETSLFFSSVKYLQKT